jgi:tetratricopeptide (TPR) repeat protein
MRGARAIGVVLVALVGACAPLQSERLRATAAAFPDPIELTQVPFFPQEEFQCGPAALATLLQHSAVEVTPEQLAPQVYLPQRRGSLQAELLAAARRHGRVPHVLAPQLEALVTEVAAGHPVLVLQNLGLAIAPTWHYAVVVGFDLARESIVLRSGSKARHVLPLDTFEYTWRRADYWGVVIAAPDQLPATAQELPYLQAVATLERIGRHAAAASAYAAALTRWPTSLPGWVGLGNARHAQGDLSGAETAYRRATELHPRSAPAHNNLAQTLADQQRYGEAETAARRAFELADSDALRAPVQQTLEAILKARATP